MFVDLPPKWIQRLGFILLLIFGSGSINGILARVGVLNSRQVSGVFQGEATLPICCFLFGVGLSMYLVPRMIYRHQQEMRTKG